MIQTFGNLAMCLFQNTTVPEFSFYVMPVGGDTNENITRNTDESVEIAKGQAVQFRLDIKVAVSNLSHEKNASFFFSRITGVWHQ